MYCWFFPPLKEISMAFWFLKLLCAGIDLTSAGLLGARSDRRVIWVGGGFSESDIGADRKDHWGARCTHV